MSLFRKSLNLIETAALLAAIAGAFLVLSGCASIRLNRAMEKLHVQYLDLFYQIENRDPVEIREAASALSQALDDPAISGYSSEEGYQKHLERTRAAAEEFVRKADAFQLNENLLRLRRQLYASCDACHKSYRR
ncbi:MAG: hypothetical protein HY717_00945 [Planctomycetes bacterium]|nr:hypothetical protein [Planctomycetota bacterium]